MATSLKIFGTHDEATLRQIRTCLEMGGEQAVLCADGHKGYAQPIGGVVAYRDRISLSGVGYDIACGNMACRLDLDARAVAGDIAALMDEIVRRISFGIGRHNQEAVDHELFADPAWRQPALRELLPTAREQLGTVGGGNHYVDLFADEAEQVWVGVHFGSRGLGHRTATHFLRAAGGRDGMDQPPTVLRVDSALGQEYLAAMHLAGRYAYAGREYVCDVVCRRILQARVVETVHNHHNFAWQEEHGGERFWVVRKGATPAFPGQRGFVGGSMGDDAVILEGVDSPAAREALFSTVHGAGRVMSRTAAAGKRRWGKGRARSGGGAISREEMLTWVQGRGICLRGGDVDEAPQAYRRLDQVLREHADTVRVLHRLRPLGVAMAGPEIFDPFKD